jgi:uncharacterized protein involved in outer membrane biogenesis
LEYWSNVFLSNTPVLLHSSTPIFSKTLAMSLPKTIRWLLFGTTGLIGLILLLLIIVSFFRIPINLESQKGLIESIAANEIERPVSIDGKIQVTTSLWPVFIIEDVHIKNPENFADGDFAWLQSARIEVGLIRLLLGKIRIKDFDVNGLKLSLRVDEKGAVNWVFNDADEEPAEPEEESEEKPERKPGELTSDAVIVDRLLLSNISVSYFRPGMEKANEFTIDKCTGSALQGEAFQITLEGTTLEEPYEVSIRAASLEELLEENKSWVDIEAEIAKAHLKFSGNIDLAEINRSLKLTLAIKGDGLDNFNRLLSLDLPPIPTYGLNASFSAMKGLIELSDIKLYVSESELIGSMKVDDTGPTPEAIIILHSPLVQINDFVFDDWSPFQEVEETAEAVKDTAVSEVEKKGARAEKVLELLSPESLKKLNANITISADKVLSGEDQLGRGKLSAGLKDGRISLDPFNLEIPGGSLSMSMSVKPGRESAEASLQVAVKNFDFGILARRADPKTNMGGVINIAVDLTASANDFTELLAHGNGYFDFSAKPENLQAGIMDLWAINVISAIVSQSVKGKSHIEYLVGRWGMQDGNLTPDVFVIDTTRMRICGKGEVDFNSRKLKLEVAPAPKKPEFFSLATPVNVQGDFSDFGLGIAPGGLVGTGIKFVISPIQVTLQTMFDKPIPADGSDLWDIELGPENRKIKSPVGCSGW